MTQLDPYIAQLKTNKNLILTGDPSTDKTYMAKQMARLMLFGKSEEKELNAAEKEIYKQHVGFVQFHPNYDYTDFVEGLQPIYNTTLGSERKDGVFKDLCKRAIAQADALPYIMIIDEINRGEPSKIFGELLSSIDPGCRGEDGMVNTRYQDLIDKHDAFAEGFYVPNNVYIIGTINDIDRSVESMDFAIRRRFAWQEILAKDSQESMLSLLEEGQDIEQKDEETNKNANDQKTFDYIWCEFEGNASDQDKIDFQNMLKDILQTNTIRQPARRIFKNGGAAKVIKLLMEKEGIIGKRTNHEEDFRQICAHFMDISKGRSTFMKAFTDYLLPTNSD